jgi:hypothetical protein
MKIKNLKSSLLICSALLLSSTNNTFAATASGSMSVTGGVVGTCTLTASAMEFGTLSRSGTTPATSTITPNCTLGVTYAVTNAADTNTLRLDGTSVLSGGMIAFPITLTSSGSGGSAGAAFTLTNAAAGYISGVGTGSASSSGLSTLTGTAASAETKLSGAYSGTVTLTITY